MMILIWYMNLGVISSYQLKTHWIKLIDTPYDMFHPGNDGQLNYIKKGNKIKFI